MAQVVLHQNNGMIWEPLQDLGWGTEVRKIENSCHPEQTFVDIFQQHYLGMLRNIKEMFHGYMYSMDLGLPGPVVASFKMGNINYGFL